MDYVNEKFFGNIPHPSLITLLCIKGCVKFSDIKEEKCSKASPLTLIGITKGPVEGEEEERIENSRKRLRAKTVEVPKEPVLRTEHAVESDNEEGEGGGRVYEAY